MIRRIALFLLIILTSGCSLLQQGSSAPTPDLDATIYWIVDDASIRISTQVAHDLDERWKAYTGQTTETTGKPLESTSTPVPISVTSIPAGLKTSQASEMSTLFPCVDEMKFVEDITIPDKTVVQAEKPFTKTWKIQNSGTCTWNDSYRLAFSQGDPMTDKTEINLPEGTIVVPDDTIEISVYMTAPKTKGSYASFWLMKNSNGDLFGTGVNRDKAIWVKVEVK
ncbi:MAG: NBR1-Ig-like domain-containing protein [Flexilinea sp.]|jgi:hypothetical protein